MIESRSEIKSYESTFNRWNQNLYVIIAVGAGTPKLAFLSTTGKHAKGCLFETCPYSKYWVLEKHHI